MPVKQTILSSVSRALSTKKDNPEEEQVGLLTSVKDSMKKLVVQGKTGFNRTKEKAKAKLFSNVKTLLEGINKNTKPAKKSFGLLKLLLLTVGGVIMKSVKGLWSVVRAFGKGVTFLTKGLRNWAKGLFLGFKKSGFGRWLKGIHTRFLGFFKNLRKTFKGGKGVIGSMGKSFARLGNMFGKVKLTFIGGIKKFASGLSGIFRIFGKVGRLLTPVLGVLGKVLWPLTAIITIVDGFKGLAKATEWFGKKKGEMTTIGEKVSAVIGSIISGLTFGLLGSGEELAKGLHKLFTKPREFFKEEFPKIITNIGGSLLNGMKRIGSFLISGVKNISLLLWDGIKGSVEMLGTLSGNIGGLLAEWGVSLKDTIISGIIGIFGTENVESLIAVTSSIKNWGIGIISSVWDGIKNSFTFVKDESGELISKSLDGLKLLGRKVLSGIKGFIKGIIDGVSNIVGLISAGAKKIVSGIKSFFSGDKKETVGVSTSSIAKEVKQTQKRGSVAIVQDSSEEEKMKTMMNFLLKEFSDVMAQKIAAAMGGGDVNSINEPEIAII